MNVIPTSRTEAHYEQVTQLDGRAYVLERAAPGQPFTPRAALALGQVQDAFQTVSNNM